MRRHEVDEMRRKSLGGRGIRTCEGTQCSQELEGVCVPGVQEVGAGGEGSGAKYGKVSRQGPAHQGSLFLYLSQGISITALLTFGAG